MWWAGGGAEEMRALTGAVSVPTMLAQVERPDAALVTAAEAKALGFKLYLVCVCRRVSMQQLKSGLSECFHSSNPATCHNPIMNVGRMSQRRRSVSGF